MEIREKLVAENIIRVTGYACGFYSESEVEEICFVPMYLYRKYETSIKDMSVYVYELDGKHSECEMDITIEEVDSPHFDCALKNFNFDKDANIMYKLEDIFQGDFEELVSFNKELDAIPKIMKFGEAIEKLKQGKKVARNGWNGNGIFIELQVPDEYSKMTQPYIFIDTLGLQTNNPNAPKGRVPWLASQTDMLAEDWQIVE